ncbi:MAG: tRNA pseudouridine(38-40) synthase TruA [Bacteroidota bacterium]|nr:tRNA pseudouridine(38-40) synthase TruA [Bacteroidota bacterium]
MRYFIQFSYLGKNYHGWQVQPNKITVQQELTQAVSLLLNEEILLVGAGRTDSGVHARKMYAHFDAEQHLDSQHLVKRLNSLLPSDVAVQEIFEVDNDAHARFDATQRTYRYYIHTQKNPFKEDISWYFNRPLNIDQMNLACKELFLHTDFQCFSKTNTDVFTYNCQIYKAFWIQDGSNLVFTITADRFLRNMVRAIVGTMINIGLGKTTPEEFRQIIKSKNRQQAGFSVPAHGLFLEDVAYPYIAPQTNP